MTLINPFPFQNSEPMPAGFCKHHRPSTAYISIPSKWTSDTTSLPGARQKPSPAATALAPNPLEELTAPAACRAGSRGRIGAESEAPFIFYAPDLPPLIIKPVRTTLPSRAGMGFRLLPVGRALVILATLCKREGLALGESGLGWGVHCTEEGKGSAHSGI